MTPPLRVVHVETGRHLYGGALQACYLAAGLRRYGVESLVVCPPDSAVARRAAASGVPVHALPMAGDLDLAFVWRLRHLLDRERPDLVHLHSRRGADVLGALAARLADVPVVLSRRVDNPEPRLWGRIKYRFCDRVIAISGPIGTALQRAGVPPDRIRCIPSAVEAEVYRVPCRDAWFRDDLDLSESDRPCGVIAQLIPRKGHRHLIAALPAILAREPRARFIFFGRGPQRAALHRLCRETGVAHAVRFAGFRDDLPACLACLELVVHPAEMEGLGVALLQAAAAGLPVVAAAAGGVQEVVESGVTGFLVPPGEPAALAEAVLRVLADRALARRLGAAARRRVTENYSVDTMVARNLAVYRELVTGAGR